MYDNLSLMITPALASDASSSDDGGSKVEWSDDEEGVDDIVQRHLKAKQEKAKKAAKGGRSKASASTPATKSARSTGRPRNTTSTGVGKIAKKPTKAKKQRGFGVASEGDSDEEDESIPDYIRNRRRAFDHKKDLMDGGGDGLQVPPNYDDIEFSDDERMEHLQERPSFTNIKPCAPYKDIPLPLSAGLIPAPIAQWLREYQVTGAAFLHELFVYQMGGILGDDMGLGKTIQVISFLTAAFGKTGDERDGKRMRKMRNHRDELWYPRVLIVCPGSLMANWRNELDRWGWWNVYKYHGSREEKESALGAAHSGYLEIMITTYRTYTNDRAAINNVKWDCVIADECHQVKERKAEVTQAMNEVNALCRIGLTGTAIQNKYEELWTLLNWTNPGKFGTLKSWTMSISNPLKTGQSHEATVNELANARKIAKKLVQNLLPGFFLRRMKSLIAHQLPKKSDRVVFCPLTSDQADAYETYVDSEIVTAIRRASEECDCGSKKKCGWCCYAILSNGERWQVYVFPAMQTLQKLSNHLALLIPQASGTKEQQEKDAENLYTAVPDKARELIRTSEDIRHYRNVNFCGKWRILSKLLDFWHKSGDKVLIFSHSVRLLKMLQMLFTSTSYNVSYLDGSIILELRQQTVDDFNADPAQFVFLISTKAGGVGLNITSANKVVIVDPHWNPSYDLQAQDRAFRIGQTRDVEVFRLVSAGTIEEIIYARQIYKQQQANIGYNASNERRYFAGVQENSEKKGEIFGLTNIFSYQGENVVLRDIVNKTNVAETRAGVQVVGLDTNGIGNSDDLDDDPLRDADDDPDDADAVMSQLAALVTDTKTKKKKTSIESDSKKRSDAVQAILSSAGVEYTHENSEVIGTSKIEAQLSRRAEEAANDVGKRTERVFAGSQFEALSSADEDEVGKMKYKFHPPEEVRRRQFCSMSAHFGFDDVVQFALAVEGWTQAQRRALLERFYRERAKMLDDAGGEGEDAVMV